jgi:PKD-like domain
MKKLFTLLIALFSFLSMSLGQSVPSITLPGTNFCISAPSTSFPVTFDYLGGIPGSTTVKIRIMNPTNTAVLYSEDFTFTSTTASSETFTANISLSENPLVANPIAGNNRVVTIANSSGLTVISVVSAPIDLRRLAVIADVGPPMTACESASPTPIMLSGVDLDGGATQGKWTIVPGGTLVGTLSLLNTLTSTPENVTFTPAANDYGTVTLRLTTNNPAPCGFVTADRVITVNPLPTLSSVTQSPALVCAGSAVTVIAAGLLPSTSGTLAYSINGTPQSPNISYSSDVSGNANVIIPAPVDGAVVQITSLSILSTGCSKTFLISSAPLVVNPNPVAAALTGITPVCVNTPVTISSSLSTSTTGPYSHVWSTLPVFGLTFPPNTPPASSVMFTPTSAGSVIVTYNVTDANGCTTTQRMTTVIVKDPPVAMLPMTPIAQCNNLTFALAAPSLALQPLTATGLWTVVSGGSVTFSDATSPTSTATITSSPTVLQWTVNDLPCGSQSTTVTLTNQTPVLGSSLTPPAICSGSTFSYNASSLPTGATFSWTRAAIGGNPLLTGSNGIINDVLINNTLANITVTYVFSLSLPGCSAGPTQNVQVVVKPKPSVTPLTPFTAVTCTGGGFTITPLTNVLNGADGSIPTGTTYSWPAPMVVPGAITGGAAGLSSSNLTSISASSLVNTTALPQTATYNVTPSFNGCSGTIFTVTVIVNPKPIITSVFTRTTCSGVAFTPVIPTNGVPDVVPTGTTYTWLLAPTVTGVMTGGAANLVGASSITGTLVNNTTSDQTATYTVTPRAGLCDGGVFTVVVTVKPAAALTNVSTTIPAICSGDAAMFTPTGGSAYSWTRVATASDGSSSSTGAINEILHNTTIAPFTATYLYTVTTTNGCVTTSIPVTVVVNPRPVITAMTKTTCSDAPFTVTPVHGPSPNNGIVPTITTYTWAAPTYSATGLTGGVANTLSGVTSITGTLSNPTSAPITATYVVTPTAGTCVGLPFNIVVTVNPNPAITNMAATYCSGVPFTVTPQNGIDGSVPVGTTYSWVAPALVGGLSGLSASATLTESNVTGTLTNTSRGQRTATYRVTPSFMGCPSPSTFDVLVTINPKPAITGMTVSTCSGPISINPTNGVNGLVPNATTSYSWSAPSVTGGMIVAAGTATTATAASGSSFTIGTLTNETTTDQIATYVVTPTASASLGGCVGATFQVVVTVKPTPVISGPSVVCEGGSTIQLTATPTPSTTNWSVLSGAASVGTTGLVTSGTAGISVITYTAANGCSSSATVTVNARPMISNIAVSPLTTICSGGSFALVPTAGSVIPPDTKYTWVAPVTTNISGAVGGGLANTISGTLTNTSNAPVTVNYIVTPSFMGCDGSPFTVSILVNPKPKLANLTSTTCSGGLAYSVTPPASSTATNIVDATTTYSWTPPTVTNISGSLLPVLNSSSFTTGILTNSTTAPIDVIYSVTPKIGLCEGEEFTITVTVNPTPQIVTAPATVVVCNGFPATATLLPTSPNVIPPGTTYAWPGGGGTALTFGTLSNSGSSPLSITYSVTPKASLALGGCTGEAFDVLITVNPTPTISGIVEICNGAKTTLTGSGFAGSTPWASSTSAATLVPTGTTCEVTGVNTGTAAVTSMITYMDNNGCQKTVTVTVNPSPAVTITPANSFVSQGCTLTGVTAVLTGGTTPYSPSGWSSPSSLISFTPTSPTMTSITALTTPVVPTSPSPTATINFSAMDSKSCVAIAATPFVLTIYPALTASTPTGFSALCMGTSGTLTSTIDGGNSTGRTITWKSTAPSIASVTNAGVVTAGTTAGTTDIEVKVTDASGCTVTSSAITITVKAAPALTVTADNVSCKNSANGVIILSGQLPGTTYTYTWTPSTLSGSTVTNLPPGTYSVVIKDISIACTQTISKTITQPLDVLTASISASAPAVCKTTPASLTFTGSGGLGAYTFKYTKNGLLQSSVTTVSGNSITVLDATPTVGTFVYALVDVTSAACNATASATATVIVNASLPLVLTPALNAGPNQLALVANTATLSGSAIPSGLTGTWTVVSGSPSATFSNMNANSPGATVSGLSPGPTTLSWTIANGACKVSANVNLNVLLPKADIYVFLEGPKKDNLPFMNANLTSLSGAATYFSLASPMTPSSTVPLSSTVLNATGNSAIVDKITIKLRTSLTGPVVATREGVVKSNGQVVDANGMSLDFNVLTGSYYVYVSHRNHLAFRSTNTVALTSAGPTPQINFGLGSVLGTAATPSLKPIGSIYYAYAGDADQDDFIDNLDFQAWFPQNGTDGFKLGDFNLDGFVDTLDFLKWLSNNGSF